jgi:excinuclease ABC subunit A
LNGAKESETVEKKGLTFRWIGLHPLLEKLGKNARKEIRQELLPFLRPRPCGVCHGTRLNELARHVKIDKLTLPMLTAQSIKEAHAFLSSIELSQEKEELLGETLSQLKKSLSFLLSIGLHYLSLDRSAPTLSGGELQRIRLSRQLGSGLTSCLYILDEPTIGLHPHNSQLLITALRHLRDLGNTLILVEHDPLIVREADYLFDFGPHAGRAGGKITAQGTLPQILKNPHSLTGSYLSGKKRIPLPKKRRPFSPDIRIESASLHNLQNLTLAIPKSAITCLTGVSGSGKSTLMRLLLLPAALYALKQKKSVEPIEYLGTRFFGLHDFDQVIAIDQSPIGQTARADVSTYTELQPLIRTHFASLPLARAKGLQPRHFSPNHLRGMCRTCWGLGYRTIDLQFLPAIRVTCESCKGYRLNPISLEVLYKEKHFGKILEMTVDEALEWFSAIPRIVKKLRTLVDVGLSYLQLGQEVASLSGGEAQRLRLSRELSKQGQGTTLYLIDEPTVGLHSADIEKLLAIFQKLADKKNTLILIEHNLDVIANADYLIDLGPEAGVEGGRIIATGTPEEVSKAKHSYTGRYLTHIL